MVCFFEMKVKYSSQYLKLNYEKAYKHWITKKLDDVCEENTEQE